MSIFQLENTSPERILLKYYVERLAALCVIVRHGSNGFHNVLLPMAIDDPCLLYALFAYASVHLSMTTPVPDILRLSRLKFEGEAARCLSRAIQHDTVSASSIACALICSTTEVLSGSTRQWFVHLRGAGHLIAQYGGPASLQGTRDGLFLLRNFAYHDIMAALSTGTRPQIPGLYWIGDKNEEEEDADCLMGLSHRILSHISELCVLIADSNDDEASTRSSEASILRRGDQIAQRLIEQPLRACPPAVNDEYDILLHHAESFRYAALLHLDRFICRIQPDRSDNVDNLVQHIMYHLSQIPFGSHCEMGLIFPLFMVGVAAAGTTTRTVEYVRQRLGHIFDWTRFEHITRMQDVLDLLWRSGRSDWDRLLLELKWQISIA